jgi:hypothetical protein
MDASADAPAVTAVHTSPDVPLVFFEVHAQALPKLNTPPEWTALRFADKNLLNKKLLTGADRYFVTVAISGTGAEPPRRFVLQKNAKGQYEMRSAIVQHALRFSSHDHHRHHHNVAVHGRPHGRCDCVQPGL